MLTEVFWHSLTERASPFQIALISIGAAVVTYGFIQLIGINDSEELDYTFTFP